MSNPMASGTARTIDSTQMDTISTTVNRGMPTPWTLLQDATALYLGRRNTQLRWQNRPRLHFFLCMAAPQTQQAAPSAKRIKMLRINEQRWSIVYFKYLIFIFLWRLQTDWPIVGRRGACLLAACVSHATNTCWLVCFINGKPLVGMF